MKTYEAKISQVTRTPKFLAQAPELDTALPGHPHLFFVFEAIYKGFLS